MNKVLVFELDLINIFKNKLEIYMSKLIKIRRIEYEFEYNEK